MFRSSLAVLAVGLMALPSVEAQTPPERVRGTIEAVDASSLTVKTEDGKVVPVALAPGYRVIGLTKATLADVTVGKFVGVGSVPGRTAAGRRRGHDLSAGQAGTGEGSRPWEAKPQGTMTNATVDSVVTATGADTLTLKYAGGSQVIHITADTVFVQLVPAARRSETGRDGDAARSG